MCLKAPGNVGKLYPGGVVGRGRQSPLLSKFILLIENKHLIPLSIVILEVANF